VEGDESGYSRQALTTLYRAAQEALTNVQRHSHARHAAITLNLGEHEATLDIEDDGVGFAPDVLSQPGAAGPNGKARKRGYGLQSMMERLELVGGALEVQSKEGEGTRLHITVPTFRVLTR
jgi:signal transduction histidine kinase